MDIKKIINRKTHSNQIPKTTSLNKLKSNEPRSPKKSMKTILYMDGNDGLTNNVHCY
jgi:hypothetical protein